LLFLQLSWLPLNYSPFRCDIENCGYAPQLHEGIVLQKINVKKKMMFLLHFFIPKIAESQPCSP